MKALYLTCERDWGMFRYSYASIPACWDVTVIVEKKDLGLPFPPGVEVIEMNFPRERQNLNGAAAVKAIVDAFCYLTAKGDDCLKVDSDTILLDPDVFSNKEYDLIGIVNTRRAGSVMGQAYKLSQKAAQSAYRFCFTRYNQPSNQSVPEDYTISRWATAGFGIKSAILPQSLLYWEYYGISARAKRNPTFPRPYHTVANYGWRVANFHNRNIASQKMAEHYELITKVHRRPLPQTI